MKSAENNEPDASIPKAEIQKSVPEPEAVPVGTGDLLYRYVAELPVAEAIARGIYRFYELTKYIKMEDEHGRGDSAEGAVTFPEEEYISNPEKLPVASYKGVEFHCISMGVDEEYLSQYLVLCMSTAEADGVMGDSKYRVEIHRDQFQLLSDLLNPPDNAPADRNGRKFFSHGPVEYYDIDNHPTPIPAQWWKEVYVKHARFAHQHEYRAAFFINDSAIARISNESEVIQRTIYHKDGAPMDFDLEFHVRAGRDPEGWRYIEIDTSEFAEKVGVEPGRIVELE